LGLRVCEYSLSLTPTQHTCIQNTHTLSISHPPWEGVEKLSHQRLRLRGGDPQAACGGGGAQPVDRPECDGLFVLCFVFFGGSGFGFGSGVCVCVLFICRRPSRVRWPFIVSVCVEIKCIRVFVCIFGEGEGILELRWGERAVCLKEACVCDRERGGLCMYVCM
jgi:hypothetical protein